MRRALARDHGRVLPTLGSEDLEARWNFHDGDFRRLLPEDLHIGRMRVADLTDGNGLGLGSNSKTMGGRACAFEYQQMIFGERGDISLCGRSGNYDCSVVRVGMRNSDRTQYLGPGTRVGSVDLKRRAW